MQKRKIEFTFEKTTKNTTRFQEVAVAGQPPIIGSLYVQTWALPAGAKKLTVTLEAEGE